MPNALDTQPTIAFLTQRSGRALPAPALELLNYPLYAGYHMTDAVVHMMAAQALEASSQWGLAAQEWGEATAKVVVQAMGAWDPRADDQSPPAPTSARAVGGMQLAQMMTRFQEEDRSGGPKAKTLRRGRIRLESPADRFAARLAAILAEYS